jgi:hypothetical protein
MSGYMRLNRGENVHVQAPGDARALEGLRRAMLGIAGEDGSHQTGSKSTFFLM